MRAGAGTVRVGAVAAARTGCPRPRRRDRAGGGGICPGPRRRGPEVAGRAAGHRDPEPRWRLRGGLRRRAAPARSSAPVRSSTTLTPDRPPEDRQRRRAEAPLPRRPDRARASGACQQRLAAQHQRAGGPEAPSDPGDLQQRSPQERDCSFRGAERAANPEGHRQLSAARVARSQRLWRTCATWRSWATSASRRSPGSRACASWSGSRCVATAGCPSWRCTARWASCRALRSTAIRSSRWCRASSGSRQLERLVVYGNDELVEMPDLEHLTRLRNLEISSNAELPSVTRPGESRPAGAAGDHAQPGARPACRGSMGWPRCAAS